MKRSISVFIIMLVLNTQLYAGMVLGSYAEISDVSYSGQDGIDKFVRATDSLSVTAKAVMKDLDGEYVEITPEIFKISIDNGDDIGFDSCSATPDQKFLCTYSVNSTSWTPNKHSIRIKLFDDYGFRQAMYDNNIYIDVVPPTITNLNLPESVGTSGIDVKFSATDSSCPDCGDACMGLSRAEIIIKNASSGGIDLSGCFFTGNFTVDASSLKPDENHSEVCLRVYDHAGFFDEECSDILADLNPPTVRNMFLVDEYGTNITFSSDEPMTVTVYAEIDESAGLSAENVVADLSELNPEMIYSGMRPAVCDRMYGYYKCAWENILVRNIRDGKAKVEISMQDHAGNSANQTITLDLPKDTSPPALVDIYTENDLFLNSHDNTIIAEISETGSGMNRARAYLSLADIGGGSDVQADRCENAGNWICYWDSKRVSGRNSGDSLKVSLTALYDDAGNLFDGAGSGVEMQYDDIKPKLINATIRGFASDTDVILEGEIVEVVAYVEDADSGISAGRAHAIFSGYEINNTAASGCTDTGSGLYMCSWEITDQIPGGTSLVLGLEIKDNAGNILRIDNAATGYVAKVEDKDVDFWSDEAVAQSQGKLNPNFLWMSSQGTMIRADIALSPKQGNPYVFDFTISECAGKFDGSSGRASSNVSIGNSSAISDNSGYESFDIVEQIKTGSTSVGLVLNIPQYEKSIVGNSSRIDIVCSGEVFQASSARGTVYRPNEKVNATITIQLMDAMFTQPGLTHIHKVTKSRDTIEDLNTWISVIDGITGWLNPICQAFNTIMSVLNNLCILISGVKWAWGSVATDECGFNAGILDTIWYGKDDEGNVLDGQRAEGFGFGSTEMGKLGMHSTKSLYSVGFWCDLVLCQDCSKQWNQNLGQLNNKFKELYPDYFKERVGNVNPLTFSPTRSLPVALLCMPPCLTGIKTNLVIYKQILTDYDACMNVAAIRGYGSGQCEEFKSSQVCQQVVGWFWSFVENFMRDIVVGLLMSYVDEYVKDNPLCPPNVGAAEAQPWYSTTCAPGVIYRVFAWFVALEDTIESIQGLADLEMDFNTEMDVVDDIDTELGEGTQHYGIFPVYE